MPQFRDQFDAAATPQSAANALKLQVGVHTQAWDAFLDALAAVSTPLALGDIFYASSATAVDKLAGNTATAKKFLSQTGNGTISAAPVWETIEAADITDFNEAVDDRVDALIQDASAGLTWTYNDAAGTLTPVFANDLAALEGMSGTGLVARTASETYAQRTLTQPAAGLTISNPAGLAGNPTFALANDLSALEALAGTGIARRTGTDVWSVGTTVTVGEGGTGATTLTGLLQGNGTSAFTAIANSSTVGQVLRVTGANTYAWGALNLADTDAVTGALPVANLAGHPTSTTDNAVVRFDGTGGNTQNSTFVVDDSGHISSFGGNITFPATQAASAGANTLDDYEEGTWTPTITCGTPGNLTIVYAERVASYTKIGREVLCQFHTQTSTFTHTTASGSVSITGFPFTSANVTNQHHMGTLWWGGVTKASYTDLGPLVTPNTTSALIVASGSGQARVQTVIGDLPTGGTVGLTGEVFYIT
jgi:hypothetical protein